MDEKQQGEQGVNDSAVGDFGTPGLSLLSLTEGLFGDVDEGVDASSLGPEDFRTFGPSGAGRRSGL